MEQLELIDITEAERLTGLDKSTLYRLVRTGRLRSFKVLSSVRFDRHDVLELVRERPARTAKG